MFMNTSLREERTPGGQTGSSTSNDRGAPIEGRRDHNGREARRQHGWGEAHWSPSAYVYCCTDLFMSASSTWTADGQVAARQSVETNHRARHCERAREAGWCGWSQIRCFAAAAPKLSGRSQARRAKGSAENMGFGGPVPSPQHGTSSQRCCLREQVWKDCLQRTCNRRPAATRRGILREEGRGLFQGGQRSPAAPVIWCFSLVRTKADPFPGFTWRNSAEIDGAL